MDKWPDKLMGNLAAWVGTKLQEEDIKPTQCCDVAIRLQRLGTGKGKLIVSNVIITPYERRVINGNPNIAILLKPKEGE